MIGLGLTSCRESDFEFDDPARGPGEYVGNGTSVSKADFVGGNDEIPEPLPVEVPDDTSHPDCGPACVEYCEGLGLKNPVNRGVCRYMWGVGLRNQPVVRSEACRRMFVDMLGRFPTRDDMIATCDGKTQGEIALNLMNREEFVRVNQRRWADKLLYDTQAVSVERVYDMDNLVGKLYRGQIPYDEFAAVVSAHPVLTRRYDTPGDRAGALFFTFMRRPPLAHEQADMGRLYNLWSNGYYDHPDLQMRLPDAHIRYRCIDEEGNPDPETKSECTSVLWGYNELILKPDIRAQSNTGGEATMWSGLMKAEEWEKMQLPGKLLTRERAFWEAAVDDVLEQYLGYDLGTEVPTVRDELVEYFLEYNGDIRALHFAVVTSIPYLQSANGPSETSYRWTYGPSKQIGAEAWIDTIKNATGYDLATCDHRLTRPGDFLDNESIASIALIDRSSWVWDEEGGVRTDYRDLARGLGGCPDNSIGGRFKIISILTTAQQLNFVNQVCDPGFEGSGVPVQTLLPDGMNPKAELTKKRAEKIFGHMTNLFAARQPLPEETEMVRSAAEDCSNCSAAKFARPTCFAVLSGAEMLFY
jgi:hypothetical protein